MAQWHSVRTVVFGPAPSPVVWTDLDLSAYVGAQRVMVAIKAEVPTVGRFVSLRTNGDAGDFRAFGAWSRGVHTMDSPIVDGTLRSALLVVETDANGVIEWIANGVSNVTLTIQGWASTQHSGASVFTGAPPAGWTDLDLSAVVGANIALALIRVEETNNVAQGLGVRRNGSAFEQVPPASETAACAYAEIMALGAGYMLVETDSAGLVEIRRANAGAGEFAVTVEAFDASGWNHPTAGEEEVFNGNLPAANANLDLTMSTSPAATGLPATEVLAFAVIHDVVGGPVSWNWRPDLDPDDWRQQTLNSAGTSAVRLRVGALWGHLVAMETESGVVEHESTAANQCELTLAGWIDAYDGHTPTISREYPADEDIVAQDTVIRFRLADASGINLSTVAVTLSCVDETRLLIVAGTWGITDGVQQATGTIIANEVQGYDFVIHPVETLDDRRWSVTVDADNSDGVALP